MIPFQDLHSTSSEHNLLHKGECSLLRFPIPHKRLRKKMSIPHVLGLIDQIQVHRHDFNAVLIVGFSLGGNQIFPYVHMGNFKTLFLELFDRI